MKSQFDIAALMEIDVLIDQTKDRYVVFAHKTLADEFIYIGWEPLHALFDNRKIQNSTVWQNIIKVYGGKYRLVILRVFENRIDAVKMASELRYSMRPLTFGTIRKRMEVRRVDTGETWKSAQAAAIANCISQGAMSNHLNRRKNYATIHGLVFEWVQ